MTNQQMELGLGKARVRRLMNRPERRQTRAQWWFDRMRAAVDKAFDWQPASQPRPEQIWFPK